MSATVLVAARGLPNVARSRTVDGGALYLPFDHPGGAARFVPSAFVAASVDEPVRLRIIRTNRPGGPIETSGVLTLTMSAITVPSGAVLNPPVAIEAAIADMTDQAGGSTAAEVVSRAADGATMLQWTLDAAATARFAAAMRNGLVPFSVAMRTGHHAVDVDRDVQGTEPLPDVIELTSDATLDLAVDAAGHAVVPAVRDDESVLVPDGLWRTEIVSLLGDDLAGVEMVGVRVLVPPRPPQRPQPAEAIAWLDDPEPAATLQLGPFEERAAEANVVGMFHTPTGAQTMSGAVRPHRGSIMFLRPDDLPVDVVRVGVEPALLELGTVRIEAVHASSGAVVTTAPLGARGAAVAISHPAETELVAVATSAATGEVVRSGRWPAVDTVVDRAWFPAFGSRTTTVEATGLGRSERVEVELCLVDEDDSHSVRLSDNWPTGEWHFLNRRPFTPTCRFRVIAGRGPEPPWLGPVVVTDRLLLERHGDAFELRPSAEEEGQNEGSDPVTPDDDGPVTETINGVTCRWSTASPEHVTYVPPTVEPDRNADGTPLVTLAVSGTTRSVQVSAVWTVTADQLAGIKQAVVARTGLDPALVRLSPEDPGGVQASLGAVDDRGDLHVLASSSTSGFAPYRAALQAIVDAPAAAAAVADAFNGSEGRLLVHYRSASIDLTGDVGRWIAASSRDHVVTIPSRA